ncbi:hypothetical protein BZL30_4125 [Mycobacterium kansasii]|uniref:Uncharacterized protein n=1 Tax=Mycobacterium kansasii TaxID=1768 RepID=A0A1V3X8E1_MYCKA|nr:hypothetical protein BZL30_4125 [Mycobacterium kansasii]
MRPAAHAVHREWDDPPAGVNVMVAVRFDEKTSGRLTTSVIAAQLLAK